MIAAYSDADKNALHVSKADKAVWVGGASPAQSYLNIDNIIQAALDSNAQSLHPGYGFLSENPALAQRCESESIRFIGPASDSIKTMASKSSAAQVAVQAGVAVLQGYRDPDQNIEKMRTHAENIGFPVLLKSAMGGGGRGMRIVQNHSQFEDALTAAQSESMQAFGDDQIIIEKYLTKARHIEVQIAADNHGNVVHLFDRECSIQRRYQKLIEEAPAPKLSIALRKRLSDAAVAIAAQLEYRSLGTIEFLLDGEDFYFMEMNTRLQVEHPVTEQVTGTDLVEWQFRIADGESISDFSVPAKPKNHSIETRIYAENPANHFMPSSGTIGSFDFPHDMSQIQIHTGFRPQDEVSQHYDPLLAKVVSTGRGRNKALSAMIEALDNVVITGVHTNVSFLSNLLRHRSFLTGTIDLGFVDKNLHDFVRLDDELPAQIAIIAAIALYSKAENNDFGSNTSERQDHKSPWHGQHGWRLNNTSSFTYLFEYRRKIRNVTLTSQFVDNTVERRYAALPERFTACYDNRTFEVLDIDSTLSRVRIQIDRTTPIQAHIDQTEDGQLNVQFQGQIYELSFSRRFVEQNQTAAQTGSLLAPMSGTVVRVVVGPGQQVATGDGLMVIEAMKMEHQISAPIDGVVSEVAYAQGEHVEEGSLCVVLKASN